MPWQVVNSVTLGGEFQLLENLTRAGYGLEPTQYNGSTAFYPFDARVEVVQSPQPSDNLYSRVFELRLYGGSTGVQFGRVTLFPYLLNPVGAAYAARVRAMPSTAGISCNVWAFV